MAVSSYRESEPGHHPSPPVPALQRERSPVRLRDLAGEREAAMAEENVQRFAEGKQVRKTIFVPDRLVSIVVA